MEWIYIIVVVLGLLALHLITEWDSIAFGVTEMFSSEIAGLPTSGCNLARIKQKIINEGIDTSNLTLIDFGCGQGDVLNEFSTDFKRVIGIELNRKLAKRAKRRTRDKSNIRIYNEDMSKYRFKKRPTMLYAYEPLWRVNPEIANDIYAKTIDNLTQICDSDTPVYIVYLSGLVRSGLSPEFFKERPFELIRKAKLGVIPYRNLYIYKSVSSTE